MKLPSPSPSPEDNANNNNQNEFGAQVPFPPKLEDAFGSTSGNSVVIRLRTTLFQHGSERAVRSGTVKPLPDDQRALEEHARAMARDTARVPFDAEKNPHDRMQQSEYGRLLERRDEVEKAEAYAKANLREADFRAARAPRAGDAPKPNEFLVAALVVAIAITVAPTLHDFVFHTLSDDLLAWFGALASGIFISLMLTLSIIHGRHTSWTWIGTIAGVTLGGGLFLLRLSSAEGTGEKLFAAGLTVVEIAEVLLLEVLAWSLRRQESGWGELKTAEDLVVRLRDAEQANLTRLQAERRELEASIQQEIRSVAERQYCSVHLPELETVAVKAVLDGYSHGIAENFAHLRGVRRVS